MANYRKATERREEIVDRAMRLFAEQGVGASLRAIADSIGVTHAALRYYFASRDELVVEVYRAHESIRLETPGRDELPAVGLMEQSIERNRSIPGLVALYLSLTTDALQGDRYPLTRDFVVQRFARVRGELAERVREGQRAGTIDATIDAGAAAALVIAATDGLQLQHLLDPDAVDVAASLALLERLLPTV